MRVTWHKLISEALELNNETWKDVLISDCTLNHVELHEEFDDGFGTEEGKPFTVWSKKHVYFPWCYDGSEGVASVSRNPNGIPTSHIGG